MGRRDEDVPVVRADGAATDAVVVERPLRVRLAARGGQPVEAWTTLRTPGHDLDLALGWSVAEGFVRSMDDVVDVAHCVDPLGRRDELDVGTARADPDAVVVRLAARELPDLAAVAAHAGATAACGLCGRDELADLVHRHAPVLRDDVAVGLDDLRVLVGGLRARQPLFAATGGCHAAATATADGRVLALREDVGRHNAVDMAVGATLRDGGGADVLLLSGRAGYELVAKAAAAGIPVVVAIGATTSLARAAAAATGITLVAFALAGHGGTVLSGAERLGVAVAASAGRASPGVSGGVVSLVGHPSRSRRSPSS